MTILRRCSAALLSAGVAVAVAGCGPTSPGIERDEVGAVPVETDPRDVDTDAPESPAETSGPTASGSAEGSAAATPSDGSGTAQPIELVETSFDISLAAAAANEEPLTVSVPAPGTYTFRVTNDSDIVHALEVEGHGVEAATGDIAAGQTATLEVELPAAGEYDLYCPVGNHKQLGMDGSVVVSGG